MYSGADRGPGGVLKHPPSMLRLNRTPSIGLTVRWIGLRNLLMLEVVTFFFFGLTRKLQMS